MAEAIQRIAAVAKAARRLEGDVGPRCRAGLPNDIARAQGEYQAAQYLRELLEQELPFDMIDHPDLHYGLRLDEERVVGGRRSGHEGEAVIIVGVRRESRPPLALCETGPAGDLLQIPVQDLEGQCSICGRRLDPNAKPGDPALDCGGDCNGCMAEVEGRPL